MKFIKYYLYELLFILRIKKRPHISEYTHVTYGVGFEVTEEAYKDMVNTLNIITYDNPPDYLTDPDAWYIKTDSSKQGIK